MFFVNSQAREDPSAWFHGLHRAPGILQDFASS